MIVPTLYMLCGLPGSTKSSWAEAKKEKLDFVIHSSDEIRTQLGNVNDQSQNELVFTTLHKRIKEDLKAGKNVCYDATNLKRKNRLHFLRQLSSNPCKKICILLATPLEVCKENNSGRERKVPETVIDRMIRSFEVPCPQEGWDDIQIIWWNFTKEGLQFDFRKDLEEWKKISHDNPHHKLSIGEHMTKAGDLMRENTFDMILQMAAYMHDCGKPDTKQFLDSKGNGSSVAHYYQHHLYGSYLSLFYLKEIAKEGQITLIDNEILYISLLIGLHMNPFLKWENSEISEEKDKKFFGEKVYMDVKKLHNIDVAAH